MGTHCEHDATLYPAVSIGAFLANLMDSAAKNATLPHNIFYIVVLQR